MKYTLYGSLRSPFVRLCRILMIQNQIPFEFKVLNFVDSKDDAAELAKETPINKVPVLIDGSQRIYDSRVIVNHLITKHSLRRLSLDDENRVSMIYACMDAGVILFLMRKEGFDIQSSGFFVSRNRNRIPECLNELKPWMQKLNPKLAEDWNYASISLYCFLYWAEAREVLSLEDYPEYAEFMKKFSASIGVSETSF